MTTPDRTFPEGVLTTLGRTCRLLRSGLVGAAAPVIGCCVAFQFLCIAVGVMVLGGDGHVVNGEIRTYGLSHEILLNVAVTLIALLAAHFAAVVIVVLIAAGLLLERPVPARSAARATARRAPALAGVIPLVGFALLPIPLLGSGGFLLTLRVWPGVFGCAVGALLNCWAMLAVPLVVLEDAGPVQALTRAWSLTRHRRARWSWSVLGPVLVVPGAVAAAGWALAWPLGESVPCGDPAILATVPVPASTGVADKPLALALGRAGRPVAAYEDLDDGELTVVSCDDASCRRSRTTALVPHRDFTIEQDDQTDTGRQAAFWAGNAYPTPSTSSFPPTTGRCSPTAIRSTAQPGCCAAAPASARPPTPACSARPAGPSRRPLSRSARTGCRSSPSTT